MVAITPQNFYVQVTFSKGDRLSIGCPVPMTLAFEERPHGRQAGRPAAHTQDFPLIQYELARSLRSLARNYDNKSARAENTFIAILCDTKFNHLSS